MISSQYLPQPLQLFKKLPRLNINLSNPSTPPPENLRGFDLYHQISHSTRRNNSKARYKTLTGELKEQLESSPNLDKLHQETLRVWKGYEIVLYIKRNFPEHAWNPFPFLGLYPREIIKDKLRLINNKPKLLVFKSDIYDLLIEESFGPIRDLKLVYCSQVYHLQPDTSTKQFELLFKLLTGKELERYQTQVEKQSLQHMVKTAVSAKSSFYAYYYNKNGLLYDLAKSWTAISKDDQKKWKLPKELTSTTEYFEKMLDLKTKVVLHYMDIVGVDNQQEYENILQKQEKLLGFNYLNKVYTEGILSSWDYNN